jgi:hypothetical protein
MQYLREKFAAWVENLSEPLRAPPDKAFSGWVKGFTTRKPPP